MFDLQAVYVVKWYGTSDEDSENTFFWKTASLTTKTRELYNDHVKSNLQWRTRVHQDQSKLRGIFCEQSSFIMGFVVAKSIEL